MRRKTILLLLPLVLSPVGVGGQVASRAENPSAASRADSVQALRTAQGAQRRFELLRRANLPWISDPGSGPCDERIGRFCIWHSSGGSTWEPPDEPERVVRGRNDLIGDLDDSAERIPGDAWIAGQRVRYLAEAERFEDAEAAALECRASEPGWCAALRGYALHAGGDFVAASAAFDAALAEMPPAQRARWTDLSALLESGDVGAYRRLRGHERDAFEARFWWLSDPLYLIEGNDRRTEHFVRHVTDRLQDRARSTEGISWGWDLRELLIRYGAPAGWERIRPRHIVALDDMRILTRYARGGRRYEPRRAYVDAPHEISREDWDLEPRIPRSTYAPAYVDSILPLEHQLAVFRRGDSLHLVAALLPPSRPDGAHTTAEAGLFFVRDEQARPAVRTATTNGSLVLDLLASDPSGILSVEALARDDRLAARARYGLAVPPLMPGQAALSDLLVLSGDQEVGDSLEEVLHLTLPRLTFAPGERIGLYWEVYGASPRTESLEIAIHLRDDEVGLLRRFATAVGLAREQHPLAVRWREHMDADRHISRGLSLELPEVGPGRYTLEVTVTLPGREPLRAQRSIQLSEESAGDP